MAQKNQVRESQAITTYGTGSIIDVPGISLMALSPDYVDLSADIGEQTPGVWDSPANAHNRIIDRRLSQHFHNTTHFVRPPAGEGAGIGIPVCRFPAAMFCPECRIIHTETRNFHGKAIFAYGGTHLNKKNEPYFCPDCYARNPQAPKKKLIPARFIIATSSGHIDDFPWLWFVTRNHRDRIILRNQAGLVMRLESTGRSASIADLFVSLKRHGENEEIICRESLGEIFSTDEDGRSTVFNTAGDLYRDFVNNQMPKPWLGRERNGKFTCFNIPAGVVPRALQRGAGNVYFPIIWSSIRLPVTADGGSYSELADMLYNRLPEIKALLEGSLQLYFGDQTDSERVTFLFATIDATPQGSLMLKEQILLGLSMHTQYSGQNLTDDMAKDLISRAFNPGSVAPKNAGPDSKAQQLRREEFDFFLQPYTTPGDFWYKSVIVPGERYADDFAAIVETVVQLDKINELRVFRGFTRVMPLLTQDLIFGNHASLEGVLKLEYDRINDPRKDPDNCSFLPASEVRGEGILIRFRSDLLQNWEANEQVRNRYSMISANHHAAYVKRQMMNGISADVDNKELMAGFSPKSARYVLLHTLSHLLIRELAMDSGYNAASLREIIYCGESDQGMDGILIYTAASDAEGTMGGLVALGRPGNLEAILEKALSNSEWCSSDPLCLDSRGQGFQSLNLAACHACSLLPETSCEAMNGFLDRGMIHGSLEDPDFGFATWSRNANLQVTA